jgi:hypothetical protein
VRAKAKDQESKHSISINEHYKNQKPVDAAFLLSFSNDPDFMNTVLKCKSV